MQQNTVELGAGRVLLIADDAARRERHAFLMQILQFECVGAGAVREALALVDEREPNLIFIDMLDEAAAIAASVRFKRYFGGTVPVLLGLSPGKIPAQQRVVESGADDYVVRPIDEVELLFKLRSMMRHASDVQELRRVNTQLDGLLRRHVGGPLVEQWLSPGGVEGNKLSGRDVEMTVLFADLNGFTRMSSQWPAERTVRLLNEIMTVCTLPLVDYGGTVDKYIGDCLMGYFGPAEEQPDHAARAVRTALAMQKALAGWMRYHRADLGGDMYVSIGLNTGRVVLGNMGSSLRLDHTVIGDPVNVAARLQDLAPAGAVYAGTRTAESTTHICAWRPLGPHNVRGRVGAIDVYALASGADA